VYPTVRLAVAWCTSAPLVPVTNVVDVYVGRLRVKLGIHHLIETIRNVGYCFHTA
jgi:DNA-binding response OmpR family regulator